MAYVKNTWATGDTITADKMNHMEDGIAGSGALIVGVEYDDAESKYTLTKTWQEIYDAVSQGIASVIVYKTPIDEYDHTYVITGAYNTGMAYAVSVATGDAIEYTTDQASGYPSLVD